MIPIISKLRMHVRCTCVALVTLICVTACSQALQVRLFNNTGYSIVLHVTAGNGFLRTEKDIVVANGLSDRFDYPGAVTMTLSISVPSCEQVTYSFPKTLQGYPWPRTSSSDTTLPVQLEPDLAIYLAPPNAMTVTDVKLSESLQVQGFPLRPSSRTCHHTTET
jgi:hypothetical protein